MSEPRIDPERLAALLDGGLDDVERARLLGELARSEEDRAVLGEAAAVLRELELAGELEPGDLLEELPDDPASDPTSGTAGGTVGGMAGAGLPPGPQPMPATPPAPAATPSSGPALTLESASPRPSTEGATEGAAGHRGHHRRPMGFAWGALAAAAVVVLAVGLWSRQGPGAGGAIGDPAALVALVAAPAPAGGDALGDVAWSVTRGTAGGDALTPRARAVRFGARAAELAFAARARDMARVRELAARTASLVEGAPASGPAAQVYRAVEVAAGAPADSLDALLRRGWATGAAAVGEPDAALGAWLAAARVAAARRDAGFFRAGASRRAADALAAHGDLDDTVRAAAGRVQAAAGGGPPGDWDALGRDVEAVLTALGS